MKDFTKYSRAVYNIIGAAMEVHGELHHGLLEAVYQEALSLELKARGIDSETEQELQIYYKHQLLEKKYRVDMIVGNVLIELKSVKQIIPAHRAQLCNYLRLTHKPVGLLLNFGDVRLYGERWAFDEDTNECYLMDKTMQRAPQNATMEDDDVWDDKFFD